VNTISVAAKSNSSPDSESLGSAMESSGSVYSSEGSVGSIFEYSGMRSSVYTGMRAMSGAQVDHTDLILSLLEGPVDVVLGLPHPRHACLVVPEPLLEMATQFAKDHRLRSLLVDFGTESLPCASSQCGERVGILFVCAVEAYDVMSTEAKNSIKNNELVAFVRYDASALSNVRLNVRRMSSHISGAALLSDRSTGSDICFLKFL
jgi:hypothetical protein